MYSEINRLSKKPSPEIPKRVLMPTMMFKPRPISSKLIQQPKPDSMQESILSSRPMTMSRPAQMPQRAFRPMPQMSRPMPPAQQASIDIDLGKINYLVQDAKVAKIECKGPGKNLIATKMGMIAQASLILTEDEVLAIIKTFSEKTHIPLIGGTFKALYKNLLMTAIISEDLGSRFIIEKRNAFALIQAKG